MSTAVLPGAPTQLGGRSLPRLAPLLAAVVAVVVAGLLVALTPAHGTAQWLVLAVLLFVVGLPAWSATVEGGRRAKDRLATTLAYAAFLCAVVPLVAVLSYTIARGLARFDGVFFTHSMRNVAAQDAGGGAYAAIVGTIEQVALAALVSIPLGILVAVYLVEYGRGPLRKVTAFFVDLMTGLPSIVAGLFVLAFWVLGLGFGYSGFAGSLALMVLMLPTVIRSSEEMLRLVPGALREGAFALGVPKWRTVVRIVLPTALPGIVTGCMLAVARVMGETAPLLLTVFGADSINNNPFKDPQASLPLYVYQQAGLPNDTAIDRAWAGALALILIVLVLNLVARLLAWWKAPRH
ncbi:MAG: phosphate ABC transporter permease PstA [Motilibacteraceae bacterium]